jgi:N-sulfoglucosamine sulfohydrolase
VTAGRPDVFVITCHDMGRHLGCYGVRTVRSPNLDRLASSGARFDAAFCSAPQCSPSRASLATGRYPHSHGVMGLAHGSFGWDLNPGERHVAALLREHGYHCHLFGLQHVTPDPARLGFHSLHAQPGEEGAGGAAAPTVAAAFERFVQAPQAGAPLYVEINFVEPHRPYDFGGVGPDRTLGVVVPPYLPQTGEAELEMAALQGAIHEVDRAIGSVVTALDGSRLSERPSLLVFSADHGIAMPRAKCTLYDPGIAIALLVRWRGEGGTAGIEVLDLVSNVDVVPTIFEAAGLPSPQHAQGISLLPLLRGESRPGRDAVYAEKTFHSYYDPMRCIRTDRFKYIRSFEAAFAVEVPGDVQQGAIFRADPSPYSADRDQPVELYDLREDPWEQDNLAGRHAVREVEAELAGRLWRWMAETRDPLLSGPTPSPRYRAAIADCVAKSSTGC